MVSAEVDVHLAILELLPGQGQRMTAAVAEQQSPKQILSPHPGRTVMFCLDGERIYFSYCCLNYSIINLV